VPGTTPLREDQHRQRAQRHQVVGDALGAAPDEWAAVAWFYSAYHLIKAALLRDPIWDNASALCRIHVDLVSQDKFTSRHKGRRSRVEGTTVEWGVNDLVQKLYRPAFGPYSRLHSASNTVRYGTGLPDGALASLGPDLKQLWEMDSRSELEAPILWGGGEQ
jgi:hypothetical protein